MGCPSDLGDWVGTYTMQQVGCLGNMEYKVRSNLRYTTLSQVGMDGIIAPRCFSCGKLIGHLWERYEKRVIKHETDMGHEKAEHYGLLKAGLVRMCCRRMFLGHNPKIAENLAMYTKGPIILPTEVPSSIKVTITKS